MVGRRSLRELVPPYFENGKGPAAKRSSDGRWTVQCSFVDSIIDDFAASWKSMRNSATVESRGSKRHARDRNPGLMNESDHLLTQRPSTDSTPPVVLRFGCPRCEQPNRRHVPAGGDVACTACGWSHAPSSAAICDGQPVQCLVCGCPDLWRQKDFPQQMGLLMVVLGISLSTIAYALWQPLWSLAILMFFAMIDFLLYAFMPDVLVCYRCGARHGGFELTAAHTHFDLETNERYRQERRRLEAAPKRSL
jgi:hypothetical protein